MSEGLLSGTGTSGYSLGVSARLRPCAAALLVVACGAAPAETDSGAATSGTTGEATSGTTDGTGAAPTSGEEPAAAWSVTRELGVDEGALFSVWGPAPDDVLAVGGQGTGPTSRGLALRWDGAAWTEVALPEGTPRLHWVTGVGDAVWAVGEAGTALRREGEHFVAVATGASVALWGIWGASDSALWAVGGDGFVGGPALLRHDGAQWLPEALPALPEDCHALFKIWGASATDITAVGDLGVALQFDGTAWSLTDTGSIADLISVHGRGGERVAVGGRANARIARWDGQAWTGETIDRPGLSGVWVASDGVATAVGSEGQILRVAPGGAAELEAKPTYLLLHAVFGFDPGPRFAVGGNLTGMPPHVGVIVQHPGP